MPAPSLDHWTTGFLLAAFMGFFMAPLLLLQAGPRKSPVGYVSLLLGLFAATLVYYVAFWSGYLRVVQLPLGFMVLLNFLYGPLFFLYLKRLGSRKAGPRSWLHFLPFALLLAAWVPLPFLMHAQRLSVTARPLQLPLFYQLYYQAQPWLFSLSLVLYGLLIERHRKDFSALKAVSGWARLVRTAYWGFVAATVSYYVLVRFPFFNSAWDYGISVAMCVFIFGVTVLAYLQPHVFAANGLPQLAEAVVPVALQPRYKNSALSTPHAQTLAVQLQALMQTEKLYRDIELRLETLAQRMQLSRHHLSQLLNEQLGMNFFEYINSLRIAEAKELLRQRHPEVLQIQEVAYQSGFNNKVSFNKAFKQETGLTPTEFRKQAAQANPDALLPAQAHGTA